MSNAPQIAEVAALVGDPARANMLVALLGGRALTAIELAYAAGVSPQLPAAILASWPPRGLSSVNQPHDREHERRDAEERAAQPHLIAGQR